jgi:hypothetical protein
VAKRSDRNDSRKHKIEVKQTESARPSWWQIALALTGLGLLVAAVVRELRRPKEERTWEGNLVGVVPYNLRRPTVRRFRETYWDPENPKILRPKVFGVGWDVNFGVLARNRRRLATARQVDAANEADVREVIDETHGRNPEATFADVVAVWHVRRGTAIDEGEIARLREVYRRKFPDRDTDLEIAREPGSSGDSRLEAS